VLSESARAALLNAVPSFESPWRDWLRDQSEYVARYPDAALAADEETREFLSHLATHLGKRVAGGELSEAEWLFAALERVYAVANEALKTELTIGFLEDLIYAIEEASGDAGVLHGVAKGPQAAQGWRNAFGYIHPERARSLGWRDV
jgi:hypothetical protein